MRLRQMPQVGAWIGGKINFLPASKNKAREGQDQEQKEVDEECQVWAVVVLMKSLTRGLRDGRI